MEWTEIQLGLTEIGEYHELLTRARLDPKLIDTLMQELDLDPDEDSTWQTLLSMAQWV